MSNNSITRVLLGLLAIAAPALGWPQAIDLTDGLWDVAGVDDANVSWDESTLKFTSATAVEGETLCDLRGYFDWRSDGGASGREIIIGTLAANLDVNMQGIQLINPSGIVQGFYFVQLTADGSTLINGNWNGPGIPSDNWSAQRTTDDESMFTADFESRCEIDSEIPASILF